MVSYALSYERAVSDRPFRCSMNPFAILPAHPKVARWCKEQGEWELEIVERSSSADTEGFVVLPHRWIVERTLGWLMRDRRLSKDHERLVQTSETFIEVAMIRLILRRRGRGA
jgi:putative transposase